MTQEASQRFPRLHFHKIHFKVRRHVQFGQAVYVSGDAPELGAWSVARSFRLRWSQGDIWSGSVLICTEKLSKVSYKYTVADYGCPDAGEVEWEVGTHNRMVDLDRPRATLICDDRWNMDRITLTVHTQTASQNTRYYVTGDIAELGSGREKKTMKPLNRHGYLLKENAINPQESVYYYTFYTYRGREKFQYYYLQRSNILRKERAPGRVYELNQPHRNHPYRHGVTHNRGETVIQDQCNLTSLVFSQVTSKIMVGNYPQSAADIATLKQQGVSAVLSIQSEKDFTKHGLTPHFVKLLCQEAGIKYRRSAIEDMNSEDFVKRALGGVKTMREWMKAGDKVYVHCSAGIYRSPQMIAVYLTLFEDYSVEKAVETLCEQHPHARPSCTVIEDTIKQLRVREARARS